MNISKVYYEELKSKCVGGKWESVRIGAEVEVGDEIYKTTTNEIVDKSLMALVTAKKFVKESLKIECGYDVEKNKEVKKFVEKINKEIQYLLATI